MYTIPTTRLTTMVGPTQGADGFGLGRGGGTYRLRLERDLGMMVDPFHRSIHSDGQAGPVTTSDRSVRRARAATGGLRAGPPAVFLLLVALVLVLAACGGNGGRAGSTGTTGGAGQGGAGSGSTGTTVGAGQGGAQTSDAIGSAPLLERSAARFRTDLASFRGRVVVLNFWASWCGPCKAEIPVLEQVSKEYAGKHVTIIGVDSSDVRATASKLLADLNVTYPTVYDKAGMYGGIATAWSVASLPQTWVVAKDGSRSGRIPRPLSAAELRSRIDQLLTAA